MIIDSHSHINHEFFIKDSKRYIEEAANSGVDAFICVGWDITSSINAIKLSKNYSNVFAAIGIHPSDVKDINEKTIEELENLIKCNKIIAIGEIGLDFYYEKDKKEQDKQLEYFIKQINLANKYNLPIIVHSRDAINLTYETLKKYKSIKGGVMHCYAAGKDYVKRYIDLGFYFGIGGVVTFKNATSVKEAVKIIPLERLLLESDAPYLTPVPYRGQSNHSKFITYTIKQIAAIKQIDEQTIASITSQNCEKLFSVKHK